jgi:hypothetical protein
VNPEPPSSRYSHRKHDGASCDACRATRSNDRRGRFALTDAGRELLEELQAEADLVDELADVDDDGPDMSRT